MKIAPYIIELVQAVIPIVIYVWIDNMEKSGCACSESWKTTFLRVTILIGVITSLFPVRSHALLFALILFNLTEAAVMMSYVIDLTVAKCECSNDWKKYAALVWPILSFVINAGFLFVYMLFVYNPPK